MLSKCFYEYHSGLVRENQNKRMLIQQHYNKQENNYLIVGIQNENITDYVLWIILDFAIDNVFNNEHLAKSIVLQQIET